MIGVRVTLDPTRDMVQQMTAAAQLTHATNQYLECNCETLDCEHYRALAPLVAAVTGVALEGIEAVAAQAIAEIDDRRVRRRLAN